MALPSVTYTFARSNAGDPTQLNRNFQDIIDALTDGTKSLNVASITGAVLGGVGGSGTAGTLVKFSAATTLANSLLSESGATVTAAADLTLSRSSSGGSVSLTVTNSSASANSHAVIPMNASNGQTYINFRSANATWGTDWRMGADPTNGTFLLDHGGFSPTTGILRITRGSVGTTSITLDMVKSGGGSDNFLKIRNTSNTGSSGALVQLEVGGTSAFDPRIQWGIAGGVTFAAGIDNSSSGDNWVLAASATLGTSDVLSITTGGDATLAGNMNISSGKVYRVDTVQVLTAQQTGLGASLSSATAGAAYTATEQAILQEAHDKIRLLEAALKVHGMVAT